MGAVKPTLHYARSGIGSPGLPALSAGFVLHCVSAGVGAILLVYSFWHSWRWEIFLALPVGIALLLAQSFLGFGGLITLLCNRHSLSFGEWWLPCLIATAGPLATGAALWHAFSSAHGC